MSCTSLRASALHSVTRDKGLEPLSKGHACRLPGAFRPLPHPFHHHLAGVRCLASVLLNRLHLELESLCNIHPEISAVRLEQVDLADGMRRTPFAVHPVASDDDSCQRREADGTVVGVDAVAGPRVVGHQHVRPPGAHKTCEFAAEGERLLQLAVLVAEEGEPGDAEDLGCGPPLPLPYLPQPPRRHLWVVAAAVPARAEDVVHLAPLAGPARDRAAAADVRVVRMGGDDQHAGWSSPPIL